MNKKNKKLVQQNLLPLSGRFCFGEKIGYNNKTKHFISLEKKYNSNKK